MNLYCANANAWFMVCLQGVKMGSMRFRFDGQPINESDTPSGVSHFFVYCTSVAKNVF